MVSARSLLFAFTLLTTAPLPAQEPAFGLGRPAPESEIQAMDTLVDQDGKLLPQGQGTASEGAQLYTQRCAMCHGPNGEGTDTPAGQAPDLIANENDEGIRHLHFATTLFSYIHRAMPMHQERSLSVDQAYALTAFLLSRNHIIEEDQVMNEQTLPEVRMPNRDAWTNPDTPQDIKVGIPEFPKIGS